ncbi:MAG: GWxTD domain-containing protein [Candidatus Glassbacteria bacterium]|nr:GWxTD domain-containing protein [Candidatus Glassbacteria bacterium]
MSTSRGVITKLAVRAMPVLTAAVVFALPVRADMLPADSLYSLAISELDRDGTRRALEMLDGALEYDPGHVRSLIERGKLHLRLGRRSAARNDFRRALSSGNPELRAEAHIGLGDVIRTMRFRGLQALAEYRLALNIDPDNKEALYRVAETGFNIRQTHGYRTAGKALTRLLCLDPGYRDAYRLWRDKILDQSRKELLLVGACLDRWLRDNPDSVRLELELARDRYKLDEPDEALRRLSELDARGTTIKRTERCLLESRCLLALGDTAGFVSRYMQALDFAARDGDYERLMLEAETIFTPKETARWDSLKTSAERAEFFRKFWTSRDPDPLDKRNERLVTHYSRLHHAQRMYRMRNPHSLFQTSRNYHHLISPVAHFYEVDPDLFYGRNRKMVLDQRGLIYVRHGPPDRYTHQVTWKDPMEIWYYGSVHFLFEQKAGAGDFIFIPSSSRGAADINQAMATDTFQDSIPPLEPEFYASEFLTEDGRIEVEFYQSLPDSAVRQLDNLVSHLGVFDSNWTELSRDSSDAWRSGGEWLAVNSTVVDTGGYLFALSSAVPGRRAVVKGVMDVVGFNPRLLDVSGLVLGSPVAAGERSHGRMGVALKPRPSSRFRRGETATVYLEIYGLGEDLRRGIRHWRQRVIVSRTKRPPRGLFSRIGRLFGIGDDELTRLTLTFDRRAATATGPAPEQFTIDTSNLAPGTYSLVVEIRDNSDGRRAAGRFEFVIEG